MDVTGLRPGVNIDRAIREQLAQVNVVVAVIGPNWLGRRIWPFKAKLWTADDWIRRELEIAKSMGLPIVPVLVAGAPVVRSIDVPAPLRFLPEILAATLRDERWHVDVQALANSIVDIAAQAGIAQPSANENSVSESSLHTTSTALAENDLEAADHVSETRHPVSNSRASPEPEIVKIPAGRF